VAALTAAGCSSSTGNAPDVNPTDPTTGNLDPGTGSATPAATAALFQPAQGIFPFPNDLYFSGTTDGTINIQPANGLIPNQVGLNALDGWSTTAPIRIRFGGALNPASFSAANIRVYQVRISNTNKSVIGFTAPLTYGTDFSANVATDGGVGPTILEIQPLKPLQPSSGPAAPGDPLPDGTGYLVLLTNGIQMVGGAAATADTDYATIKSTLGATPSPASAANCTTLPNAPLQGACGLTLSHLLVAGNPALGPLALDPANVIVSFHFTTVATRDTLRALGQIILNPMAPTPPIAVSAAPGIPLPTFNPALPDVANVRLGTVTVPYYSYIPQVAAPGVISTDALTLRTAWRAAAAPPAPLADPASERNLTRFNPIPEKRADKAIPLLISVPNANSAAPTKPAAGWPVVIFEHGITRDRSDALALAGTFGNLGWAVASVDLPLHGITATASPLYQAANEQTFNLDLVVNASGAAGPDSVIDSTGTHFINLAYPLASRDNLRQGVVNLLALTRALPTLDLDGDPNTVDIDVNRIAFVGQSLGSIVGITYGAVLPTQILLPAQTNTLTRTMTFSMPGGGVASLLQTSPTFGPRINAGLQGQGLLPGTSLYAQYFRDVQNIVDAADPLNYITQTVAQRAIYIQQVVGGGTAAAGCTGVLPDQVIPNSATAKLLTAVGATALPRVPPGPRFGSGYVNFVNGDHGSLLSPTACGAATVEMQTETATFTLSGNPPSPGVSNPVINVSNAAVVQP
jgi:hypothetical protein